MASISGRGSHLERIVGQIQRRWGPKALHRLGPSAPAATIPSVPTGFPDLDQALGIGGVPRGRITELLSTPTSGMMTLALRVIAHAQAAGSPAVALDLGGTFDPEYAARSGVNLDTLLLVHPRTAVEALEIAQTLIASGGVGVLVFDSIAHLLAEPEGSRMLSAALRRLIGPLAGSPCALLFLNPLSPDDTMSVATAPSGLALPHYAAVRLLLEKEQWLHRRRDVLGYQVRVTVLKNKLAAAHRPVPIAITFE
ncbi:MAG: DNA recombination/repair protein RecA [Ardenticatenaceae bacterium]|nr:DNA recombination/repair protein RecA [Ardenticatenaceae bacterium]HBY92593.1 DNA recombination/repair protein RecA [Chloroflexota bacterium]